MIKISLILDTNTLYKTNIESCLTLNPNNIKRIKREYLTRHNNDKSKFKDSSSVEVLFINHTLLTKLKIELNNLHKGSFYFSTNRKISLISNGGKRI